MPYRDGTGPEGKGPGTGRGFGNCDDTRPHLGSRFTRGLYARHFSNKGRNNK